MLAGRHLPPEQLLGKAHPGLPARSHPLEDALEGEMHRVCVCGGAVQVTLGAPCTSLRPGGMEEASLVGGRQEVGQKAGDPM